MKGSTLSSRDKSLLERVETPTGEVSLMQRVETKFLAGNNLNTLLIIHIQHLTIFYNKIPRKALHWAVLPPSQMVFCFNQQAANTLGESCIHDLKLRPNQERLFQQAKENNMISARVKRKV